MAISASFLVRLRTGVGVRAQHECLKGGLLPASTRTMASVAAAASNDEPAKPQQGRRIYILGSGNVGTLVAHSLASLPSSSRPPITLLLHRQGLLNDWKARGATIDLLRYPDGASQPRGGIDVELTEHALPAPTAVTTASSDRPIQQLIVSVLASQTNRALVPVKDRLGPGSSILFLQNGIGSADEAARKLFPDPATRPTFMLGIVAAGAWTMEPFVVRHTAVGKLPIGVVPRSLSKVRDGPESISASARQLLDTLAAATVLQTEEIDYKELLQRQLEKLVINAIVNPLTGILDQPNAVVQRPTLASLIAAMVAELSNIIQAMPELKDVPGAQDRFSPERLQVHAAKIFDAVKANTSSTAQHLRLGKKTEIEYINGYLVRRAEELGVLCPLTSAMRQLVLTKEAIGLEQRIQ
jgi:2-dehydropantoate 2-reductase